MPKIIVKSPFKFAHFGYQVEEFEASGEACDTSDECAFLAIAEGWAVAADADACTGSEKHSHANGQADAFGDVDAKAHAAAPENKDAAKARKTKAANEDPAP